MKRRIGCAVALFLFAGSARGESPLFTEGHPERRAFVSWVHGYGALGADRKHVAVYLATADAAGVSVGTPAVVHLGEDPEEDSAVTGAVTDILRDADPRTGQAIVTISIPPAQKPPRTYASARLSVNPRTALALPSSAVLWQAGRWCVVRRAKDGDRETVPVKVGRQDSDFTEIVSGLSASDTVLVEGALEWTNRGTEAP